MPPPRVTVDELPEQVTLETSNYVIVQDSGVTKKMQVDRVTGAIDAAVAVHTSDPTGAHAASAISFVPTGTIASANVQAAIAEVAAEASAGGLPVGGTAGQVLTKQSGVDGDADWDDPAGGGAVDSVNGETGVVVLDAADVGAAAAVHTHAIADTTGLQAALDGKQPLDADLTDLVAKWTGRTTTEADFLRFTEASTNGNDSTFLVGTQVVPPGGIQVRLPAAAGTLALQSAVDGKQAASADLDDLVLRWNPASASAAANLRFREDTDNGTNEIILIGPNSVAADAQVILPSTGGTLALQSEVAAKQDADPDLTTLASRWNTRTTTVPDHLDFAEASDNGTGAIRLRAPVAVSGDTALTVTLPATSGTLALQSEVAAKQDAHADLTQLVNRWTTAATGVSGDQIAFTEMPDNGSNFVVLRPTQAMTGNQTVTLPDATGTVALVGHTHTSSDVTDLAEFVRDTMGTALVAGANVTITPNDGADTITIASSGGGGGGLADGDFGDITVSGTGTVMTIDPAVVTLAKMANLAQDQVIGRVTASTGVPETFTVTAAARTVLDDTSVANMVNTLGGATSTGSGGLARATSPTFVTPVLGTPTSGTLTNCTGLPVAGITASTVTAVGVGSVELGHATDTTLSRSAAGRLAVEGVDVVLLSVAQTLTNKTLTSPVINTPTGIVKGDVGLGNVDNTSDATKNAAAVTLTNKTLTAPVVNAGTFSNLGQVEYDVNVVAASGSTETLDLSLFSVHDVTMDAGCTFTFANPAPSGEASVFILILRGAFTPVFPASVDWGDATPPTYTTPSMYGFITRDAGTTYLGVSLGKAFG